MSTLRADNIGKTGASATSSTMKGRANAWASINQVGANATRDSLNVSSATDNGSGSITLNMTSAFASANYCVGATGDGGDAIATAKRFGLTNTASAGRVDYYNSSFVATDCAFAHALFFGELA